MLVTSILVTVLPRDHLVFTRTRNRVNIVSLF